MKVLYHILYSFIWLLSLLPLSVLYLISDVVAFVLYHVVKYRRGIVRKNLTNSFPEKSEEEITKIEKDFYLYLCDTFIEAFKMVNMSEKEFTQRMKFTNTELADRINQEGRSIIALMAHCGNWEWISYINAFLPYCQVGCLYRPQKNKNFDQLFVDLRQLHGTVAIPKNDVLRFVINSLKEKKTFLLGVLADQTPSKNNLHYWTTFLNQETPFLNGMERIAKKQDLAVIYFDIKRIKRGYYECDLVLISEHAKDAPEHEITDRYVELLEKNIQRSPQCWLWSHKRWKYNFDDATPNAVFRQRK
jgi:KDO2-lipid IV(A) lauroyltransferase